MAKYRIADDGPHSVTCRATGWAAVKGGPAQRIPAGVSPNVLKAVKDGVLVKDKSGNVPDAPNAGPIEEGALRAVREIIKTGNPSSLTTSGAPKVPDIEKALIGYGHDSAVARSYVTPELRDKLHATVAAEIAKDAADAKAGDDDAKPGDEPKE